MASEIEMNSRVADAVLRSGGANEAAVMAEWSQWLFEQHASDLLTRAVMLAVFPTAWEHGHSAGLQEVEGYFSDFCGLAERILLAARAG